MKPHPSTLLGLIFLASFAVDGALNISLADTWIGTCSCNYQSQATECEGTWGISGTSSDDLARRCANMTGGHGSLSGVHVNTSPPPPPLPLDVGMCDQARGITQGAVQSEIVGQAGKTITGGGTDSVCATIPPKVTVTDTLCGVRGDDRPDVGSGWCRFDFGTAGCPIGFIRSNLMNETHNADGSRTICWNLNNQSTFPRYVDFLIMK